MISHWLAPDNRASIRPERLSRGALWHKIKFIHDSESADYGTGDVVLLSFDPGMSRKVKRHLYQFSATPVKGFQLLDGGHFVQGDPTSVTPAFDELRASGALTVILGPPPGFVRHQMVESKLTCLVKASNLDDDILFGQSPSLPMLQYIATQRHLVSESHQQVEGHLRLSDVKDDIALAEPCIRDADRMIFHCDAIGASETGYMTGMSASGLSIVEACQLFRYAGAAPALSSIGIYGYDTEKDADGRMANIIAQMIWYLMEGTMLREDPDKSRLTQYIVQPSGTDHTLHF